VRGPLARSNPAAQTERVALCEHHNWIAGQARPIVGDRWFAPTVRPADARARGELERLDHRWPESSAADVRAAIEAAALVSPRWAARSREQRWAEVKEWAKALVRELDIASIADDFGLAPDEYSTHASEHELRLFEALEMHREGAHAEGVVAFGAHWSDGAAGIVARAVARLLSGQTLVVLGDRRAPHCADALALALEFSTLPPGVVNVLHAASNEARDALLGTGGLAGVRWKAPEHELDALTARFRAHITSNWELWRCVNRTELVCEHDNPAEAAESIAAQAFSRSATLSGQHPGQVARVLCHPRRFSRLCEELRARLDGDPELHRPAPPLDDDLERHVLKCWAAGLDEGATPIFGGPPDARARVGSAGLEGVVFVNVDPAGALCRFTRPAPVLSLARVSSDEEGRELRAQFDLPPRRPLLSAFA